MQKLLNSKIIYKDISNSSKTNYTISTPQIYIFYFKNKSGDLTFEISSENAKVYIFGEYDANVNEKYLLNTHQIHKEKNSESHIVLKGVFRKNSTFIYNGTIEVEKKASKSIATLENINILAQENARVTTNPILKIKPHDVICKHGASISDIDKNHIAFLESRGINKQDAKSILIKGFLSSTQQKINSLLEGNLVENEK